MDGRQIVGTLFQNTAASHETLERAVIDLIDQTFKLPRPFGLHLWELTIVHDFHHSRLAKTFYITTVREDMAEALTDCKEMLDRPQSKEQWSNAGISCISYKGHISG